MHGDFEPLDEYNGDIIRIDRLIEFLPTEQTFPFESIHAEFFFVFASSTARPMPATPFNPNNANISTNIFINHLPIYYIYQPYR